MDDQCLSEAKTDRVLAIYSRLVGGAVLNKADLAQQFHVTQRSIQRDIESLRCFFAEQELPQDIVYDKRSRGYRLIDNAQKKLSNSEVLAVCKILLESRSMVTDEMMPLVSSTAASPNRTKPSSKAWWPTNVFTTSRPTTASACSTASGRSARPSATTRSWRSSTSG